MCEPAASDDGFRVLADQLRPRDFSKERAHLDRWAKEADPSPVFLNAWHGDARDPEFNHATVLRDAPRELAA